MASFLDLSLDVRYRIYAYANLVRSCPIELNSPYSYDQPVQPSPYGGIQFRTRNECLFAWRKAGADMSLLPNWPDCICPKLPLQLFFVSHAIYEEVFSIFYSYNKFVIRLYGAVDLESLRLGPHILGTMTSLLVRLNPWPCLRGHEEAYPNGSRCLTCDSLTDAELPLDIATLKGQALLEDWRRFAENLALHILPGQLRFTLICDVVDMNSGSAVLKPLLKFPLLEGCVIRLKRRFNYELYELARATSLRTQCLYHEAQGAFPFQLLPKEIRLHIITYTHFGSHNTYPEFDRLLRIERNRLVKGNAISIQSRKNCCQKCTETLVDCCCVPIRAAYSLTCECRKIPFEISLVSKQMRADVMEVLMSQNCFDFLQDPEMTVEFLGNLPQGSLRFSRRLQLRFAEGEVQNWNQLGYLRKLTRLVLFMRNNFVLERLSLTIVVESWDLGCEAETDEDTRYIYDVYCDIAQALSPLHGLEDLTFEFGWFSGLEPLIKEAILGEHHPKCLSKEERIISDRMWSAVPSWYREVDFITG